AEWPSLVDDVPGNAVPHEADADQADAMFHVSTPVRNSRVSGRSGDRTAQMPAGHLLEGMAGRAQHVLGEVLADRKSERRIRGNDGGSTILHRFKSSRRDGNQ